MLKPIDFKGAPKMDTGFYDFKDKFKYFNHLIHDTNRNESCFLIFPYVQKSPHDGWRYEAVSTTFVCI